MKKLFFILQLMSLFVFAACCSDDDVPRPYVDPNGQMTENTIFVYMPWSGYSDSNSGLYNDFQTNLKDIKKAIVAQGGLHNTKLLVFVSEKVDKGNLINVQYKNGACVDDTLEVFNNKLSDKKLNSQQWITTILKRVKKEAPARTYSMIVGCHGKGWIPASSESSYASARSRAVNFGENKGFIGPRTRWFGGSAYMLDISDFAKGIANSGIGKLQYIMFDDCNMTGVEVAYELRNNAHYIIGSPTEIMAYGMPYELLWRELSKTQPDYNHICTEFINFYTNYTYDGTPYPYGTISVIDCSQAEGMANVMKEIYSTNSLATVSEDSIQSMDGYLPSMFYDMGDYVHRLLPSNPQLLAKFDQQLSKLVPFKGHTESYYTSLRSAWTGTVLPIKTYSGITISDPSTNSLVTSSLNKDAFYQATH